jgi:hypothetical protein
MIYLHYQNKTGMAELWGNFGDVLTVDIKGGIVSVAG